MQAKLLDLSPHEFENLTYDLMQSAGLRNLVWRTPGADGGRDIEGISHHNDLSGAVTTEKWYIECKRYSSSIDWPTVWEKIGYAENMDADYLLLVTNSNPSPNCETQISLWNTKRRHPKVRVWRGYELERVLRSHSAVSAKYGLLPEGTALELEFMPVLIDLMKASQASYATMEFGSDPLCGLEFCAALSELISLRMNQLREFGRVLPSEDSTEPPDYPWLSWPGEYGVWETAGIRATLCACRYMLGAATIDVVAAGSIATIQANRCRVKLTSAIVRSLSNVALWSNIEISGYTVDPNALIRVRRRENL